MPLTLAHQMERKRPELRHVRGGDQTAGEIGLRGIKVYEAANMLSKTEYQIENKLQRKARILGL